MEPTTRSITAAALRTFEDLPRADELEDPETVVVTTTGTFHRVDLGSGTLYLFHDGAGTEDAIYYENGLAYVPTAAEVTRAFELLDGKGYDA